MKILAIDPAIKCGWALYVDGDVVASGTWNLSVRRDESSGMRLIRMRSKLRELQEEGIDLVVYEGARHGGAKMQGALVVAANFVATILLWAQDADIEYRAYSPTEIKKHATGKGNAGKPAMIAAAKERWPDFSGDDNEADARHLVMLAASMYDV